MCSRASRAGLEVGLGFSLNKINAFYLGWTDLSRSYSSFGLLAIVKVTYFVDEILAITKKI